VSTLEVSSLALDVDLTCDQHLTSQTPVRWVGSTPFTGDFGVFFGVQAVEQVFGSAVLDATPNLARFAARMAARPRIAAYVSSAQHYAPLTLSPAEEQVKQLARLLVD